MKAACKNQLREAPSQLPADVSVGPSVGPPSWFQDVVGQLKSSCEPVAY